MPNRSKFSLNLSDYDDIDPRLKPFLKDWKVIEEYKNKTVEIPGTWDSDIFPVKYFEVIKESGDPNYDPDGSEDEIVLVIEAGWKGYDSEVITSLFIRGKDVHDEKDFKVSAEILKAGGAPMRVFFRDKLVTDFTKLQPSYFFGMEMSKTSINADKIWIDDMTNFLTNKF